MCDLVQAESNFGFNLLKLLSDVKSLLCLVMSLLGDFRGGEIFGDFSDMNA